ncbi:MAG: succinate dehydrogenase assembly factor 2 [Paracoccaceae bacterium]|nr:succinate dehydrogenase assembly factor 2 [Paracoccaceae bacterium]MDG2256999.1 succinate dehydrogenase assembly factor 2 [Paracoccaceae bacterium]
MSETRENRKKRLKMRSMRRGIKEMDIILSSYADAKLDSMSDADLDLYEALLSEADLDMYQWVSGQSATPAQYLGLMTEISANMDR